MSKNNQHQEVVSDKEMGQLIELLKEIPDNVLIGEVEDRIRQETSVVHATSQSTFSGPIPPPAMLKEYDAVQEGFADRIGSSIKIKSGRTPLAESLYRGHGSGLSRHCRLHAQRRDYCESASFGVTG